MKNVRKVRVFECIKGTNALPDSPVRGNIYSEDYNFGGRIYTVGQQFELGLIGAYVYKLLGTIEVDCTPPTVEETPLPKKRRFKLLRGSLWRRFVEGRVYDEDYRAPYDQSPVSFHATQGRYKEDWQEVLDEDEKIAPPTYPDPIYLSYDDVVRGMWYDVREVLPDEGFNGIRILTEHDGDELDLLEVMWDNDFGGFIGYHFGEVYEKITKWKVPK
jgi:hypothetical protein